MRRREFITLIGGAAATWPLAALAQQAAMPVVGYVSAATPNEGEPLAAAFRRGLQETGYVVGQNVAIEYRWAEQQIDRLPAMAADLVQRHVTVIAAVSTPAVLVAQAAACLFPLLQVQLPLLHAQHKRHTKAATAAQPQIACTVVGCMPVPRGCHPEMGYTPGGIPTGFDVAVCPNYTLYGNHR